MYFVVEINWVINRKGDSLPRSLTLPVIANNTPEAGHMFFKILGMEPGWCCHKDAWSLHVSKSTKTHYEALMRSISERN